MKYYISPRNIAIYKVDDNGLMYIMYADSFKNKDVPDAQWKYHSDWVPLEYRDGERSSIEAITKRGLVPISEAEVFMKLI